MTPDTTTDKTFVFLKRRTPRIGQVVRKAFCEHKACMRDVQTLCRRYLNTPDGTPVIYQVGPGAIPSSYFNFRKNLFSTLFVSVYHLLDIPQERRLLYGRLNHLFRIWVTSADNLLDGEDKVVIPLHMQGRSRTMRQVVTLMAADRVLIDILGGAVSGGVITAKDSEAISEQSLRCLLPSAAQEASEEGGITEPRLLPDDVLWTVHRYKTGILFHVPFLGPEIVEKNMDRHLLGELQDALMNFGLGCQLLDDIRDMARDLIEKRHNYVLSLLAHRQPGTLSRLGESVRSVDERLYLAVPGIGAETARKALSMMTKSLTVLGRSGLGIPQLAAARLAKSMMTVLDLGDLEYAT